ncbi:MAG: helix-turn-helix domain-containing protein, partial [Bifidobacteriaceae bacterium]|nr:helix-turn-helix domain-containing protein [Bifidobacteriaceae bacterium]
MLTTAELCALLGVPVSTVYDWRVHGKGPVAHRFGKHL